MIESVDIVLPLESSEDDAARRKAAADNLGILVSRIGGVRLRKHSIDARQKSIKVQVRLDVALDAPLPPKIVPTWSAPPLSSNARKVVIIGCGPAGLFAALRCLESGAKPILLERGKDASSRRFDLAPLLREGRVIEESNYCFGEGGAGEAAGFHGCDEVFGEADGCAFGTVGVGLPGLLGFGFEGGEVFHGE